MERSTPVASPDAYVAALDGWRRDRVEQMRAAVRAAGDFDEIIKWGHPVYLSDGPALLIRAEANRVLLGFWRGQRLLGLEQRLRSGGQYEMATVSLTEADPPVPDQTVTALAAAARRLNAELGDPTRDARKEPK